MASASEAARLFFEDTGLLIDEPHHDIIEDALVALITQACREGAEAMRERCAARVDAALSIPRSNRQAIAAALRALPLE